MEKHPDIRLENQKCDSQYVLIIHFPQLQQTCLLLKYAKWIGYFFCPCIFFNIIDLYDIKDPFFFLNSYHLTHVSKKFLPDWANLDFLTKKKLFFEYSFPCRSSDLWCYLQIFDGKEGRPRYPRRWVILPPFL